MAASNSLGVGYIYCFSNAAMPGIYKIGRTDRPPCLRLQEANKGTYSPPMPYKLEFAKQVNTPVYQEIQLFHVLNEFRICSTKEFVQCSLERIRKEFAKIEGTMWMDTPEHRHYKPTEPFEGHVYHNCSATIRGFRLNYIDRELFPPCRNGVECPCKTFSNLDWKLHIQEVHSKRLRAHNAQFPRPQPRPRRAKPRAVPVVPPAHGDAENQKHEEDALHSKERKKVHFNPSTGTRF